MAIDWSKNISFSGLTKKKPKANESFPEKTYMNLVVREKREFEPKRVVLLAVVLVLAVGLFAKFGVLNFVDAVNQKEAQLHSQQQQLSALQTKLANYEDVLKEYESYEASSLGYGNEIVSPMEALVLVDRYIAPVADITLLNISGNTVTLNISDISLDGVGKLVNTLYDQPMVADVQVSTAATKQSSEDTTAALVITLQVV